jgi:hypothetical protein
MNGILVTEQQELPRKLSLKGKVLPLSFTALKLKLGSLKRMEKNLKRVNYVWSKKRALG